MAILANQVDSAIPTPSTSGTTDLSTRKNAPGAAGMYLVMAAMVNLINEIQVYAGTLINLGVGVSQTHLSRANSVLAAMSGGPNSIEAQIQAVVNSGDDPTTKANKLAPLTSQMTVLNNQYNQVNSFFGSIENGLNQSSTDTTQTESLGYQLMEQGPLTLFQTIVQIL